VATASGPDTAIAGRLPVAGCRLPVTTANWPRVAGRYVWGNGRGAWPAVINWLNRPTRASGGH